MTTHPEIWIAPWGNDTNPGTSNRPLHSFAAAYAKLPDGGTVQLHAGNYDYRTGDNPPEGVTLTGQKAATTEAELKRRRA